MAFFCSRWKQVQRPTTGKGQRVRNLGTIHLKWDVSISSLPQDYGPACFFCSVLLGFGTIVIKPFPSTPRDLGRTGSRKSVRANRDGEHQGDEVF